MKPATAKVYLSGIGIVGLAFFFWLFMYQMFVNVNADASRVQVFFDTTRMQVSEGEMVDINPYFFTKETNKISAATYTIQYPHKFVSFVSAMSTANIYSDNENEKRCINNDYRLNQIIKVDDNPEQGTLTVTRVALERTANLPSGLFCIGTLRFKVAHSAGNTTMDKIHFGSLESWQIVGPNGLYKPVSAGNNEVLLIYR